MKRKLFLVSCLCAVVATICLFLTLKNSPMEIIKISADYPVYETFDNLTDRADTIIMGEIIDFTYNQLNISEAPQTDNEFLNPGNDTDNNTLPYTIYTVKIEEIYKGNINTDTIEIKQLGGVFGNTNYVFESAADIEQGIDYIFFLETYDNSPASLLNPIQSIYEYGINDSITPNTNTKNNIQFKINDLDEITNSNIYK